MKKIVSAILALMMVLSMSAMVFAAEDTFVPSITYKDAPELVRIEIFDGENWVAVPAHCLLITPVSQAEKETRLPVEAKDLLLSVYEQLNNGSMKLPENILKKAGLEPKSAIIRELVDINWICAEENPTHAEMMKQEDVQLRLTFELKGLEKGEPISVQSYGDGKWEAIANVENKGDGLVVCTFDHLCPIAFVVGPEGLPETGVEIDSKLIVWAAVLVVSTVALAVVVTGRRKNVA